MQETPQQYIASTLGYLEGREPLKILSSTPRQLAALIKGARKAKLAKRPAPGKWSVTEILGHTADTEGVVGFRIRLILGANGTPIQGFDQDAWAKFSSYARQEPALSLEAFRVNRERTVQLLKTLPPRMWGFYGMHSERGKETVERVTEMLAGHDLNHLSQIRRILQSQRPARRSRARRT
jgi:hypothetical protein